ncbi:MAG: hypothetical protein HY298_17305 [Verrucomicrobia bacterium]|nr:hypothetical protein [Verrucomicrobiota bacterium]
MFKNLLLIVAVVAAANAQTGRERHVDSKADPHWEGYRNQLIPNPIPITRQDFGFRTTRYTGSTNGEIGGWIQRSITPAYYAKVIPTKTLQDKLTASGKFAVTRDDGAAGMLIGWFNEKSRGWRTPNSLVFRIDGNGGRYWLFYEYGTRNWLTGGGGCFEGERYQTTTTKPFLADGTVHEWTLSYDPDASDGNGLLTFMVDGRKYSQPLAPGHKADGAAFDRFGAFNVQVTGGGMEAYVSDLTLDGHVLDLQTGWEAKGNKVEFEERVIRPYDYFGYTRANETTKGKIGGIIWRDEKLAYYADKVGPLTLDDELFASGKLAFNGAGSDSAVFLGWFDSASKTNKVTSEIKERQKNLLAILIEGPSRVGHYFRPAYTTASGTGISEDSGPIIRPDGLVHKWSIRYSPRATDGSGQIIVTFDKQTQTLTLKPEHRRSGATFDRFGLFNLQTGGHFVDVSLDDLTYTVRAK